MFGGVMGTDFLLPRLLVAAGVEDGAVVARSP
jgi:hypothetical protein